MFTILSDPIKFHSCYCRETSFWRCSPTIPMSFSRFHFPDSFLIYPVAYIILIRYSFLGQTILLCKSCDFILWLILFLFQVLWPGLTVAVKNCNFCIKPEIILEFYNCLVRQINGILALCMIDFAYITINKYDKIKYKAIIIS